MTVRCGYVDTHIGQVHYRSAGDHGPVVVLLHQTASSSRMFAGLMGALSGAFRLIAFDTPGFGNSTVFDSLPTISGYSEVLHEAVGNLGVESFHLLGHHTGAAIATQWAADHPQVVLSLSTIGALAMGNSERQRWLSEIVESPVQTDGSHFASAWERVAHIDAEPVVFSPSPELQHREAVDQLIASPRWPEAYLAVFAHDYEAALDRVECPILLICGNEDILWPYFEATASRRSGAKTFTTKAGAYILDQQPGQVFPVIKSFLEPSVQTN